MATPEFRNKEILFKEIDLIEDCIKHMASNSFLLKGWTVIVLSILLGLVANFNSWQLGSLLAIFVCVGFWYLDSVYLKLERLYTRQYNWGIKERKNTDDYQFNLDPFEKKCGLSPNVNIYGLSK